MDRQPCSVDNPGHLGDEGPEGRVGPLASMLVGDSPPADTVAKFVALMAPSPLALKLAFPDSLATVGKPWLRIVLDCGNVREYSTSAQCPPRSVQCPCSDFPWPGHAEHYFIKYSQPTDLAVAEQSVKDY